MPIDLPVVLIIAVVALFVAATVAQRSGEHADLKAGRRRPVGAHRSGPIGAVLDVLTPAQRRVLVALCRPYKESTFATPASNQQIADELTISVDAVKTTMRKLFELFGLSSAGANQTLQRL